MSSKDEFVTADDGVRLFAQTVGRGRQTVVIPNGLYLVDDFRFLAEGRTIIAYDPRNRGRSDAVTDRDRLKDGIHHDVADLESVRRHFNAGRISLFGHSYIGMLMLLYAMKFPDRVTRVLQIGPIGPDQQTKYPAHLTNTDRILQETLVKIEQLQQERRSLDPVEFCLKFWSILNVIYVANPADVARIKWSRCDLANERNFWGPWTEFILPSLQRLAFTKEDFASVTAPVLTIHGTKDRSSPYGAGRDWTLR
jgi:proline iminopeptidase